MEIELMPCQLRLSAQVVDPRFPDSVKECAQFLVARTYTYIYSTQEMSMQAHLDFVGR